MSLPSDDNYPPYIYRDAQGKLQGIIVDQWALWEKKTGIHVTIAAMDWAQAMEFMRRGEADVLDTVFVNPERPAIIFFFKALCPN